MAYSPPIQTEAAPFTTRAGADLSGLIHHSDRGVQYRSIRYTQRLEQAEAVASVGSRGDSYDNALAEAFNSLFKAELVRNKGPWKVINHLEVAVAEYIDWFNHRRLHGELGQVPPAEYETLHAQHPTPEPAPKIQIGRSLRNPGLDSWLEVMASSISELTTYRSRVAGLVTCSLMVIAPLALRLMTSMEESTTSGSV